MLTCSDPSQALATIVLERPDVVLLDLMMPGVSGFEILSAMQDDPRLKRIPVIVLSGKSRGGVGGDLQAMQRYTAIAGKPRNRPSIAAATVPE